MFFKIYDQNDKALTESIRLAGLSEYKTQKLIRVANENKISLQKAYLLTDASVIKVDIILLFVMSFLSFQLHKKILMSYGRFF